MGKLDLELLQQVRVLVTHANCPDGTASAMVCKAAFPGWEVRFCQYGTPEHRDMPAEPGLLFVDFSPHESRATEFANAGTIVLDHHKTARAVVEAHGARGVFADEDVEPGVSGAVLAYRHVFEPVKGGGFGMVRMFAELAGVRDTWQRNDQRWRDACAQAMALKFLAPWYWLGLGWVDWADEWERVGWPLLDKLDADVERVLAEAYRFTTLKGTRVAVFNSTALTSDAMEHAQVDADVVVGFHYRVATNGAQQLNLSLRSRGPDVSKFCVAFGGGGHTRAAGCTMPVYEDNTPYEQIEAELVGVDGV